MTKRKPTLADAGREPQTIVDLEKWQLFANKKIVDLGLKLDRNAVDICQLLSEINIAKQLKTTLDDLNNAVKDVKFKSCLRIIFWGGLGGFLAFGFLILLAWWWFR